MRLLVFLVSLSLMLYPQKLSVDKTFKIRCNHTFVSTTGRLHNLIEIDSKKMTCYCGKDPVFVFISFGHLECYCLYHAKLSLSALSKKEFDEQKI